MTDADIITGLRELARRRRQAAAANAFDATRVRNSTDAAIFAAAADRLETLLTPEIPTDNPTAVVPRELLCRCLGAAQALRGRAALDGSWPQTLRDQNRQLVADLEAALAGDGRNHG